MSVMTMPTVSISDLGQLDPVSVNLDEYQETSKSSFRLPAAGRYTLRAPDSFNGEGVFSAAGPQKRNLAARIDPTIVGPSDAGFTVKYVRVSNTPFSNDANTSWMGRYLKACGLSGRLTNAQEWADAVASTAGRMYEADLDWVAEHRATGFKVKGMKNFPQNADGSYQSWVDHPTEKAADGSGRPLRVFANLEVKRYIAAS